MFQFEDTCDTPVRCRHGLGGQTIAAGTLHAMLISKTRIGINIALQVFTVLVAPLLAVVILDGRMIDFVVCEHVFAESCLRYYLSFSPKLNDVMVSSGIPMTGGAAYRYV